MGFAKNLGKGFIRSAVNQVGRDAGKVVSNQVYGDAHSTPHRIVDNKTIHNNEDNESAEYIKSHSTFGIIKEYYLHSCVTFSVVLYYSSMG